MVFSHQTLEIGGVKTHVYQAGSGKPLLWFHGAGGITGITPFFEGLAQRYQVFLVDHPGWGRSERPEWLRDFTDYNYFYRDFLAYFGLERVNLVGNSLGGRIALEFAISHPQHVEKLVLLAPDGLHVDGVKRPDIFILTPEQRARVVFHDQKFADALLARPLSDADHEIAAKNLATQARLSWERNYNPRFPRLLKYVAAPTRLIWGADDRMIPLAHGEEFARHIPGAELHVIKDCGHLPQIEQRDECLRLVEQFIG